MGKGQMIVYLLLMRLSAVLQVLLDPLLHFGTFQLGEVNAPGQVGERFLIAHVHFDFFEPAGLGLGPKMINLGQSSIGTWTHLCNTMVNRLLKLPHWYNTFLT